MFQRKKLLLLWRISALSGSSFFLLLFFSCGGLWNLDRYSVSMQINELKLTFSLCDFCLLIWYCRARLFGWPNTYVFTKAMGEMLLVNFKDSLPLVIIRPTMVASTCKEPFPGWIEGVRWIYSLTSMCVCVCLDFLNLLSQINLHVLPL